MTQTPPDASILVLIGDDSPADAAGTVADLRAQRGIQAQIVLVDHSDGGLDLSALAGPDLTVVRAAAFGRSAALLEGVARCRAPAIGLRTVGSRSNPDWLARSVAALQGSGAGLVTSNYFLSRANGEMAYNIDPSREGTAPPPGWDAALVFSRGALAALSPAPCRPNLLLLYWALLEAKAVHHIDDALFSVSAETFALERFRANWDFHTARSFQEPFEADDPWVSVLVDSQGDRAALRRCLDGLCRQVLPANTYEIIVADRGEGTLAAELASLPWTLPFRALDCAGLSAAEALGRAFDYARGTLVLSLDAALTASPDTVEQHIRAHRENDPRELAVTGHIDLPVSAIQLALPRALADGSFQRDRPHPEDGFVQGLRQLDRRNFSVPRVALLAVGGFGAGLPDAALDADLAQRLDDRGTSLYHRENARVVLLSVPDLAELEAERVERARAFIHLVNRHPDLADLAVEPVNRDALQARLDDNAATVHTIRAAAATLGGLSLAALEPIGEDWRALSADLSSRLQALLGHLDALWRARGHIEGLDELGAPSLDALVARHPEALPGARATRYLLCPQRNSEDSWLMAAARYLTGFDDRDDCSLVLLANAGDDGYSVDALQRGISELTQRIPAPRFGGWAHVLIVDESTRSRGLLRLVAGMAGWQPSGGALDAELSQAAQVCGVPQADALGWEHLKSGGQPAYPMQTEAPRRVLAWPDWTSEADLDALIDRFARTLVGRGDAALCLRFREGLDGDSDAGLQRLQAAFDRHLQPEDYLEIFLFDDALDAEQLRALGASVDAVAHLPSASEQPHRAAFQQGTQVPTAASAAELAALLDRLARQFSGPLVPAVTWTL